MTRSYLFLCASLVLRADAWGFCADNDSSCGNWAKKGECEKDHVKKLCPHSCSVCTHTCRDSDPSCKQWGELGECEKNMMAMFKDCPVTCGVCKTKCYDKDVDCGGWVRARAALAPPRPSRPSPERGTARARVCAGARRPLQEGPQPVHDVPRLVRHLHTPVPRQAERLPPVGVRESVHRQPGLHAQGVPALVHGLQ